MKPAIALASVLLVLAAAAPAGAYDTGPHFEMTDDVMTAEGFRGDAIGVAQVNNWFVDFYEQAGKNPFSGHGGFWKRLLAGAIDTENWSDDVIAAAERSHFDSSTSTLFNTVGVTNEWDRLRRSVWTLVREARAQNDRAKLLAVLGMSLHQVQDFYTHTNWIEPVSGLGAEGPGWRSRGFGTQPDVVRRARAHARRGHDLHREHAGPSAPARGLERRRQHQHGQDDVEGLAGAAALHAVGDRRPLRLSPVGAGRALLGRRRRLLGQGPALPREPAPARPRPGRRVRRSPSTAATGRARASPSGARAGRAGA